MLRELLTLIDALPEAGGGDSQPPEAQLQPLTLTLTLTLTLILTLTLTQPNPNPNPPEAQLQPLMERNQRLARPAADGCVRRWKEGGCRHCPRWSELGELWRGAAERRRG